MKELSLKTYMVPVGYNSRNQSIIWERVPQNVAHVMLVEHVPDKDLARSQMEQVIKDFMQAIKEEYPQLFNQDDNETKR